MSTEHTWSTVPQIESAFAPSFGLANAVEHGDGGRTGNENAFASAAHNVVGVRLAKKSSQTLWLLSGVEKSRLLSLAADPPATRTYRHTVSVHVAQHPPPPEQSIIQRG